MTGKITSTHIYKDNRWNCGGLISLEDGSRVSFTEDQLLDLKLRDRILGTAVEFTRDGSAALRVRRSTRDITWEE